MIDHYYWLRGSEPKVVRELLGGKGSSYVRPMGRDRSCFWVSNEGLVPLGEMYFESQLVPGLLMRPMEVEEEHFKGMYYLHDHRYVNKVYWSAIMEYSRGYWWRGRRYAKHQ